MEALISLFWWSDAILAGRGVQPCRRRVFFGVVVCRVARMRNTRFYKNTHTKVHSREEKYLLLLFSGLPGQCTEKLPHYKYMGAVGFLLSCFDVVGTRKLNGIPPVFATL